jgi:hypothetical protein
VTSHSKIPLPRLFELFIKVGCASLCLSSASIPFSNEKEVSRQKNKKKEVLTL